MEHLVTFKSAEGREGQHTAKTLEDALKFVERLRNHEGATDVRVFRMQEIPIEFKAYYKVELKGGDAPGAEDGAEADEAPETAEVAERPVAAAAHAQVGGDGAGDGGEAHRRLFNRG